MKNYKRNESLISNARVLRKNMTRQERMLWFHFLRHCTPRFRRQEIIGNYIADFYCHAAKLVIELDGSHHYEPEERNRDNTRSEYFHKVGLKIIRFSNTDVDMRLESVCNAILLALEQCGISAQINYE